MTKRDFTRMATVALETAVARVWEEHRKNGTPVAVWKNGKVQQVIPKAKALVTQRGPRVKN